MNSKYKSVYGSGTNSHWVKINLILLLCFIFHTPRFPHSAFSTFSTLRVFHTPHFPHSAFSTLRVFHTPRFPHSAFSTLRIFHTPHFPHSVFSTLRIFHTPHFPHSALRIFHLTRFSYRFLMGLRPQGLLALSFCNLNFQVFISQMSFSFW